MTNEDVKRAVGQQLDFKGATLEQYDQVTQKAGFRPGGPGFPGGLFHWVTRTADGIRITNVWKSQADCDTFSPRVAAMTKEVGMPGPPTVQLFEVHNYHTAG